MSAPTPVDVVDDGGAFSTLVIEDGVIPRRVRRPADLLRLAIALVAFAVTVAITYFLNATSAGIEQDLVQASTGLPAIAGTVLNLVGGLGVLLLPVAAGIDMIVRRRGRQLVDAMAAAFLGIVLAVLVAGLVAAYGSPQLLVGITGVNAPDEKFVLSPVLVGLVAFVTVSRLLGRGRWGVAAVVVVLAAAIGTLTSGASTATVLGLSILLGWAVGLATRYILGTPTTRPSGIEVADSLERAGLPVTLLRASKSTATGRQYAASTRDGERLRVVVFDRDLEGAGIAAVVLAAAEAAHRPREPARLLDARAARARRAHVVRRHRGRRLRAEAAHGDRGRAGLDAAGVRPRRGGHLRRGRARRPSPTATSTASSVPCARCTTSASCTGP